MVLHTVPNGHMMVNQKSPEQLKAVVKAESPSAKQDFNTGTTQWPSFNGFMQGRPGGFVRVSSPHRHSPVSGQSSPRLEHQFNRQREREAPYDEYGQEQKRSRIGNSVHTIHSQMQSHLLSPRGITSSRTSPPSTIHSTLPSPKFSESQSSSDTDSTQVAPAPRLSPSVGLNPLDEPSPLGLVLKKTPSLLDLISMKLAQGSSGEHSIGNGNPETLSQDGGAKGSAKCLVPAATAQDKLKASNFPASSLKIGTWERLSRYEGDLVGKCYYAKRKLVWEVLESGLKSKIEIQWSDISALKATYPENLPGTLEIEVSRPPLFFRETNPQPRKHTLWQATSDFTGGQATICKRHSLQFPEGVLNRHYEKLVQCDPRLKALAEGTLSTRAVTDYEHSSWFYDGKLSHLHSHQPTHHPLARHNSGRDVNSNQPSLVLSRMQALQGSGPLPHAEILLEAKAEVGQINMQSNDLSPTAGAAAEGHRNEEGTNVAGEDLRLHNSISEYERLDLKYQNATNMGVHELVDMKPARHDLLRVGAEDSPNAHMGLEEIAQVLLGDPTSSAHEPAMMFNTNYGQLSSPTSGGNFAQQPLVSQTLERSDLSDASQGFSPFRPNGDECHGDHQLDVMSDPSSLSEILQRDMSSGSLLPCMNRHGSTSDFQLINFPRVASLPQLFETPQQAPIPVGRYDSTYMRTSYYSSEKLR